MSFRDGDEARLGNIGRTLLSCIHRTRLLPSLPSPDEYVRPLPRPSFRVALPRCTPAVCIALRAVAINHTSLLSIAIITRVNRGWNFDRQRALMRNVCNFICAWLPLRRSSVA
jgi:hypothetical protein